MVVESFKIKEQRLLTEIKQLKEDLEKANTALEHNNTVLVDTVSERNKLEQELNNSYTISKELNKRIHLKDGDISKLESLSLIDRIFNYKKHFNIKEDE